MASSNLARHSLKHWRISLITPSQILVTITVTFVWLAGADCVRLPVESAPPISDPTDALPSSVVLVPSAWSKMSIVAR